MTRGQIAKPTKARKRLTPSLEDYLETVFVLSRRTGVARVRDIARELGVAMPSVTAAMRSLSKRKLVDHDPYELIGLTDLGKSTARQISRRHEVIRQFLTQVLCLDADRADANACRMEHAVDDVLLDRLGKFAELIQDTYANRPTWRRKFRRFCRQADADAPSGAGRETSDKRRRGFEEPSNAG